MLESADFARIREMQYPYDAVDIIHKLKPATEVNDTCSVNTGAMYTRIQPLTPSTTIMFTLIMNLMPILHIYTSYSFHNNLVCTCNDPCVVRSGTFRFSMGL